MHFYAICGQATTPLIQKDDLHILPEAILRRGEPVRICCDAFTAAVGTEGYYLLPRRRHYPGCAPAPYSYLVLS